MLHVEKFLNYLKYEKRYSGHTQISYKTDLDQFSQFLVGNSLDTNPAQINYRHIRSWVVSLVESGTSTRSVNRKLSTLKSFFKFLQKEEIVNSDPLKKITSPKVGKKLPVFVEEKQMDQLIDEIEFDETYSGKRNKLIIETFYFTGIRLSELINLKNADVDLLGFSIKVLGKRNKERIVPITCEFAAQLKEFSQFKKSEGFKVAGSDVFFQTIKGAKMYPNAIYRIIHAYLKLVTSIEKKSPHVLRHTFATHMLNHGADLNAIKELLGHANLLATQVYTHNTFEKLTRIYKQAHPRA